MRSPHGLQQRSLYGNIFARQALSGIVDAQWLVAMCYFSSDIELEENQFGHYLLDKQSGVLE